MEWGAQKDKPERGNAQWEKRGKREKQNTTRNAQKIRSKAMNTHNAEVGQYTQIRSGIIIVNQIVTVIVK